MFKGPYQVCIISWRTLSGDARPPVTGDLGASDKLRAFCGMSADCERLLERTMTQQGLSARAHDRILKVTRTIADLESLPAILPKHIAESIQYGTLDRTSWT